MALDDLFGMKTLDLPEPQRSTIVAALTQLVLERLGEELYEKLSDPDKLALETLIDNNGSEEEIFSFFKQRFPDYEERAKQIAEEEKQELDDKMKTMLEVVKNKKPQ